MPDKGDPLEVEPEVEPEDTRDQGKNPRPGPTQMKPRGLL